MQRLSTPLVQLLLLTGMIGGMLVFASCGTAIPFSAEEELGPAVLAGSDESRADGSDLGAIYEVTQITEATSGIAGWNAADLPFTGSSVAIGQAVTDGQTPITFSFSYPPNNYKLAESHVVIDTSRDNSDTEGIFVDGVFSGRPPAGMVNGTSTKITDAVYIGSGAATTNSYYNDFSIAHYKRNTRNTFDLNLADLLTPTALTTVDALEDGFLPVVTGDDSPIYQAYLVNTGYTISKSALQCSTSPTYTFQNVFLHNDGNSVGAQAFSGTVRAPSVAWTNGWAGAPESVEFYFDALLPRVTTQNITLTSGQLSLRVKRAASGAAAIVVNGVGVAQSGFARSQATSEVESWDDSATATAAWENFVASIPATDTDTAVTLNLAALLGASTLRDLIAQGKLNIALAGSLAMAYGQAATSTRGFGVAVAGPELQLQGQYFTRLCSVPNNPNSPLSDDSVTPGSCDFDQGGPLVTSVQAAEITASTAKIVWLTNEGATSQAQYGVGNTDTASGVESTLKTFHTVTLTGLLPYKYYYYRARSVDHCGNATTSGIKVFRTLR